MLSINWKEILNKVPDPYYKVSNSRTSIWRQKKSIWNPKKLYFGIWISFNVDGSRISWKKEYKKQIEAIKHCLSTKELEALYRWVDMKYYKVSKTIKEVNSKWKLFMHLLFILPFIKENLKDNNPEALIAKTLYNCTRSWYTNWLKKNKDKSLSKNI